jgi:hypothetical protein
MNIRLFAQIFPKFSRNSFNKLTDRFESNKHSKGNDAWSHFVTMVFCHFSKYNSLNDVCNRMRSATGHLNPLGLANAMRRSSLAYNNQHRNWAVFQAMYYKLYEPFESTLKTFGSCCPNESYICLIRPR